jgi:hypothetical protein
MRSPEYIGCTCEKGEKDGGKEVVIQKLPDQRRT